MRIKPGLRFQVKNPHPAAAAVSKYEVIRVEGNVCVCCDLDTRHFLAMPVSFVKRKISKPTKKEKQ